MDAHRTWQLPELVADLSKPGRDASSFLGPTAGGLGIKPQPGRITVTTQHRSKGMEWDTVHMVGIDGF